MTPISLEPQTEDTSQPISLDTSENQVTNSPAVIDSRAKKAAFALKSTTGKTYEDAMQALSQGQESQLRKETASTIDMQKSIQQRQLVSQMATRMGGTISKDQLQFAKDKATMAALMGQAAPTNPDTVLEEYYAGEYLKPMYDISDQFNKGSFMPMAMQQIPEQVKALQRVGESIIARREVAQKIYQDARDKYEQQSILGKAADWGKSLIPGYYENKLRGNTTQTSWLGGGLRGTMLQNTMSALEGLPLDEYQKQLQAAVDKVGADNPDAAVTLANAALGQTTSEKRLNNIFSLVDIASIPAVGVGKAMLSGGRSLAVAVAEKVELRNLVASATKDAVKSTEGTGPTLREIVNAHFGEQSAKINYDLGQLRQEFKARSTEDISVSPYKNEGLRSQALTRIATQISKKEAELKDLQSWHADHMAQGYDIHINQDYEPDPSVKAMAGRGDLGAAATYRVADNVVDDLKGKADPEKQSVDALPSFLNSDLEDFKANPGHGGQEVVNRVVEQTTSFRANLLNIAKNIMRVQRVPALMQDPSKWTEAIRSAVEAVKDYTKASYPGIRNSILNISNPRFEPITNTYHMDMIIGKSDATYFSSKIEAEAYAKQYGLLEITTAEKDGLGWYIKATKPLDETSSAVRDMLLQTREAVTPDSWLNSFLGWARTPEETLSFENRMQRKLATYNASAFLQFAKETARDIGKGGFKNLRNWKDWERVIDAARSLPDPDDATKIGYFFKDGGELDNFYLSNVKRLPTVIEKSAYFAYKRINEYDRVLRTMSLYRNKSRVGVESHSISMIDEAGKKTSSDFFDGVTKNVLPASDDSIVILGNKKGGILYQGVAHNIPPRLRAKLGPAIQRGEQKVIEVYDPEKKPLNGFLNSNSRIRYVVTESSESKPISLTDQVPRRGGGHFDYDYPSYIKQANMEFDEATGFNWYNGDRTLMPMSIRGLGKNIVERLNKVRELIRDNKLDEAKAFATSKDGVPSIPWDQHLGWYQDSEGANGQRLPPRLSKDEPFRVINKDESINNVDNELQFRYGDSFKDGTKQGSLARQAQVQYTGERDSFDVHTLTDIGSRHNPIYDYEPAKLVDPITTMNRALSRIVNSTFMDDYKIFSVEHWIREARQWLNVHDPSEIDRSPFHYFNRAEEYWLPNMPPEVYRQLMSNRMKIKQLVGTPSAVDNFLHSAQQALVDSIYGAAGPKAMQITPSWLLPSLSDPTRFLRSIVFNAKMGLFAVPQFMVHAMTTVNAIGIAGMRPGLQGTFAALLHGWYHINPSMLDHLDGLASKFFLGWKPGELKESIEAANRTGFMNVAGEHAYLDTPLANRIVSNGWNKFLDAGQMFFRGGVTSLRAASWHMAYKEWRALNPTGRILDDDLKRILERADILSHNMTRASTSVLTKGVMSVPAQFYTYQLRLFELMTGSRLTAVEKARLFGTNMAFFGVPAAMGLYGYPFGDILRTHAQANGYVAGDKFYTSIAMEGLPSWIGNLVSGTFYNVGGRYGAQGIGTLEDLTEGDKTMWQIFGGAAFSSLSNVWAQSNGLRTAIMQAIRGEGDFKLTSDDAWGPFQEISSINQFHKTLAAINFGNWLTKSGAPLYPTSPMQAVFQGLSGLTDQRATDVWQKSLTLKEHRAYDNSLYGLFQKEFTLGTQAMSNKDPEGAKTHIKNAFVYLNQFGYPPEKIPEAISAAVRNNQSIIDRVDYDLFVKDPRSRDIDTFNKIQSMKQGK